MKPDPPMLTRARGGAGSRSLEKQLGFALLSVMLVCIVGGSEALRVLETRDQKRALINQHRLRLETLSDALLSAVIIEDVAVLEEVLEKQVRLHSDTAQLTIRNRAGRQIARWPPDTKSAPGDLRLEASLVVETPGAEPYQVGMLTLDLRTEGMSQEVSTRVTRLRWILSITLLSLTGGFVFWLRRLAVTPIQALNERLLDLTEGGSGGEIPNKPLPDELRRLNESIDLLDRALRERREADERLMTEQLRTLEAESRERALRNTNEELARVSQLKDDFLARVSHELRTPLSSILGHSEALISGMYGALEELPFSKVEVVHRSSLHLSALIDDILRSSRLEAGRESASPKLLDSAQVARESLEFIAIDAEAKQLEVVFSEPAQTIMAFVDPRHLRQVLINLLVNAVKFTPSGRRLGLSIEAGDQVTRFRVWDEGVGLAGLSEETLYEPFLQAETGLQRQHEGFGLGLSISKHLCELNSGDLGYEASREQGACFVVTLPSSGQAAPIDPDDSRELPCALHAADELTAARRPAIFAAGLTHIAIVEDNLQNQRLVADFLTAKGYQTSAFSNGMEALEAIFASPPSLVLLDIQMPGISGFEVTRRLRQHPKTSSLPIVAFTGMGLARDRKRCKEAGFSGFLRKPFRLNELEATLIQHLSPESPKPSPLTSAGEGDKDDPGGRGSARTPERSERPSASLRRSEPSAKPQSREVGGSPKASGAAAPRASREQRERGGGATAAQAGDTSTQRSAPRAQPEPLLLADDNAINRELLAELLSTLGVEVKLAIDGVHALSKFRERAYSLIILDIQMPGLTGLEVISAVRAEEAGSSRRTPALALTGLSSPEDRRRCLEAGFDDVIGKPFRLGQLRSALESYGLLGESSP